MAMDRFTLEELARLSDAEAVRRRFDARNVAVIRWLLRLFALIVFGELMALLHEGAAGGRVALVLVNALLVLILIPVFRRVESGRRGGRLRFLDSLANRVAPAPRSVVLGTIVLQFLLTVLVAGTTEGADSVLTMFPLVGLFLHLAPSQLLLLELLFFLTAVVQSMARLFGSTTNFDPGIAIASGVIASVVLIVRLLMTRRFRKKFLQQWREQQEAAREQIRMREELEFAREIQLGMLPLETPSLDWLDIATVSLPATEVGGDYFDYFEMEGGKLAVVACDVAGHGLASGLVLSGVRSCLTLLAEELDRPAVVMEKMHRMVRRTDRHRMLVTLAIVLLDPERSRLVIASAGHPPLLIRRASGAVVEVEFESVPLGAPLGDGFAERELPVGKGDLLVLHTDGIYEALDPHEEQYGIDRLVAAVEGQPSDASAQQVRDAIIRDLWTFKGEARQQDDITLVVMKLI